MHPLLFIALVTLGLGSVSYGVNMMPLEPQPKQVCHFGLVIGYLAIMAHHFGLV